MLWVNRVLFISQMGTACIVYHGSGNVGGFYLLWRIEIDASPLVPRRFSGKAQCLAEGSCHRCSEVIVNDVAGVSRRDFSCLTGWMSPAGKTPSSRFIGSLFVHCGERLGRFSRRDLFAAAQMLVNLRYLRATRLLLFRSTGGKL